MIIDQLENWRRYLNVHPGFKKAFQGLTHFASKPFVSGRHELWGPRLIAIVEAGEGRSRQHAPLEAHRRYIDIQFTYQGSEEIGWKHYNTCQSVKEAYSDERDIEFFADAPDLWLPLPVHSFAIFFPEEDAHAPLAGVAPVQKIIMKVAI